MFGSIARLITVLAAAVGTVSALTIGSAVTFGKGSYPRATKLSDGRLLGTTSYSDGANMVIMTVISSDNGASWTTQGEVTRAQGDISNQYLQQLPSGRILIAFRNHSKDSNGNITLFRITVCSSDDSGKTWAWMSQPASDPAGPNGNWEPLLRLSTSNVLQLYYSRENSGTDQDSLLRTSTDGGTTWSSSQIISGANVTQRDGMIGVTNYGGKNLIAVFETTLNGRFQVWSVTSADDGATWGNRRIVYAPTAANSNAGAPQVVIVGSTLVASFMTDEDSPNGNWPASAAMKIVTSTNQGASWGNKATIFSNSPNSYWPGLLALNSTTFLALADRGGSKAKRVTL
ncbi:Sialidase [Auriculariales sp. MPI-PUGE-AT-0066]|nr:Sialidase [Auriculariales sp. MPI-PUGE-AT-0066]